MDMSRRGKKILFTVLMLCTVLLLAGCRTRTGITPDGAAAGAGPARERLTASEESDTETDGEPGGKTRENPEAQRREFDEKAPVQIVSGAERALHLQGEGDGAGSAAENENRVHRVNEQAESAASQRVAAQEAERMGVSSDAAAADSALTYYTVLLRERTGSLFECQRLSLYWETKADHVTVHRSSPEHALILEAGVYDVSARLLPENLQVDDGWIARKNPGVIVKITGSDILGTGVSSAGKAQSLCRSLTAREGWQGMDAVKAGRVLLLSEELFEPPWPKTAALILIARAAYGELLEEADPEEALRLLYEEAMGAPPAGRYYYLSGEE